MTWSRRGRQLVPLGWPCISEELTIPRWWSISTGTAFSGVVATQVSNSKSKGFAR